jgi:small subunit ribosomal protein S17
MSDQKAGSAAPPRAARKTRVGVVTSDKMTRTVTVQLERQFAHPIYGKRIRRTTKFHARDELGAAIGDTVRIMETRPLSKTVSWRVVEILERAK